MIEKLRWAPVVQPWSTHHRNEDPPPVLHEGLTWLWALRQGLAFPLELCCRFEMSPLGHCKESPVSYVNTELSWLKLG